MPLRDWIPEQRPLEIQQAIQDLDPSGKLRTKLLKVQGTRDSVHYPHNEVQYIEKIIGSGRLGKLEYCSGGSSTTWICSRRRWRQVRTPAT